MSSFDKMKCASELGAQVYWKNLAYGPTGSGKTWFTASFKQPLIALTEIQGLSSIQAANPNAVPVQNPKTGKVGIESVAAIEAFKKMLRDPTLPEYFDAVGIDSLTEIQRIYKDHFTAQYEQHLKNGGDPNGFWVFGQVLQQMIAFCRAVRNAPVHASVICLERQDKDSKGRVLKTYPDLEGGIRSSVGQFFNSVCYVSKRARANGTRHELNFNAGAKYDTKTMPAFDDIEPPEPLYLLHKRFGDDLPSDVAERVAEWRAMGEEKEDEEES